MTSRIYKSTNLYTISDNEFVTIRDKIKLQAKCIDAIKNLSIYIQNLPKNFMFHGIKIVNEPSDNAKLRAKNYNDTPDFLLEMLGTKLIPLDYHEHWNSLFNELLINLDVEDNELLTFLLSVNDESINATNQVMNEQERFIDSDKKQFVDTYYLEIYANDIRVVSMFVRNIPPIQTHFFIVNDLQYLIKNKREVPNSAMLMHSFASSLFGNDYWYTDPVGSMGNILDSKLKSTSHEKTSRNELDMLTKTINNKYYLGTNNSVKPAYKYLISDFMKNLWKTYTIIKHSNENDKELLGKIYEPTVTTENGVVSYKFIYEKIGGRNLLEFFKSLSLKYIILIVLCIILIWYFYNTFYKKHENFIHPTFKFN